MTIYNYILNVLQMNNKTIKDIDWIGCSQFEINKEQFIEYTKHRYYNEVSLNIPYDLIIAGKDFWIEIVEDNGIDILQYKTFPIKPEQKESLLFFSTYDIDFEKEGKQLKLDIPNEKNLYHNMSMGENSLKILLDYTKYRETN